MMPEANANDVDLLRRLCTTAGVPGREHRVRDLILGELASLPKGFLDEVRVDPMGSIVATRKGGGGDDAERIMIATHMDQIGFLVRYIDQAKGWLRLQPVGGFDPRNLFARRARVCPDVADPSKDLPAVMNPGVKPLHVSTPEDRKKVPEIEEFYLDLGLPAEQVAERVKIGDMVVLDANLSEVGNAVVSQALDNRIACCVALETLKALAGSPDQRPNGDLIFVFTVQEEVGLRGALATTSTIQPTVGIALDTTLCIDTPGVPDEQQCTVAGAGVGLKVMDSSAIANFELFNDVIAVAEQNDIPHQRAVMPRGGTDAGGMQRQAGGVRTLTLAVPTRYIHTVTEMIHHTDWAAARTLMVAYCRGV